MKAPKVIASKPPKAPPPAKPAGRIENLGAFAHPPKRKK